MEIIAIEFDRVRFPTLPSCLVWMQTTGRMDLDALRDRTSFKLKSGNSIFLSGEKRRVWGFYGKLWREKKFESERLDTHVVCIRGVPGSGYWDESNVPTILPITQEKRQKLELQQQRREFKRQEAAEKLKEKRKRESKESKKRKEHPQTAAEPLNDLIAINKKPPRKKITKAEMVQKAMTAQPITPLFNLDGDPLGDPSPAISAALKEMDDDTEPREGHPNLLLDETL